MKENNDGLLTEKEAIAWLSIGRVQLWKLVKEGLIPRISIGKKSKRYHIDDLRNYVNENRSFGNTGLSDNTGLGTGGLGQ